MAWLQLLLFCAIWVVGVVASIVHPRIEAYNVMKKDPNAFPECTNCVRYFDTVICKCNKPAEQDGQVAFMYPTDITPDVDLSAIDRKQ